MEQWGCSELEHFEEPIELSVDLALSKLKQTNSGEAFKDFLEVSVQINEVRSLNIQLFKEVADLQAQRSSRKRKVTASDLSGLRKLKRGETFAKAVELSQTLLALRTDESISAPTKAVKKSVQKRRRSRTGKKRRRSRTGNQAEMVLAEKKLRKGRPVGISAVRGDKSIEDVSHFPEG